MMVKVVVSTPQGDFEIVTDPAMLEFIGIEINGEVKRIDELVIKSIEIVG